MSVVAHVDALTGQLRQRMSYDAFGRMRLILNADIDGNGRVDEDDLSIFATQYTSEVGQEEGPRTTDFNGDGVVDDGDLSLFAQWYDDQTGDKPARDAVRVAYHGYIPEHATLMYIGDETRMTRYLGRMRWYDARLGRWLTRDPAGYVDGLNVYLFVGGNPLMFVDPTGLYSVWESLQIAGSFVAGAGEGAWAITKGVVKNVVVEPAKMAYDGVGSQVELASHGLYNLGVTDSVYLHQNASGMYRAFGDPNAGGTFVERFVSNAPLVADTVADMGTLGAKSVVEGAFRFYQTGDVDQLGEDVSEGVLGLVGAKALGSRGGSPRAGASPSLLPAAAQAKLPAGPVKPGQSATYAELKAQKKIFGETEALDMDHQPSFAAQVAAKQAAFSRKLTAAELAALKANTPAVASPRAVHQQTSPTYGGRNSPARISKDAADLDAAAARDRAAFDEAMRNR
jgi:filamentous hemagglutinin